MTACFVRLTFLPSLCWLLPFPFLRGTSTRTAAIPAQFQADHLRWQKRTMWNTIVLLLSLFAKHTAQFSLFQKSVRPDIVSSRSVQRYFLSFKSVRPDIVSSRSVQRYFLSFKSVQHDFQDRTVTKISFRSEQHDFSLSESYSTNFSFRTARCSLLLKRTARFSFITAQRFFSLSPPPPPPFQKRTVEISLPKAYSTIFSPSEAYTAIFSPSNAYSKSFIFCCRIVQYEFVSFGSIQRYFLSFRSVQ